MENIETQCDIVAVRDDNNWRYSIDADIPAFGTRTFKYLSWRKGQGDPPEVGQRGIGTFEPYRRSNYYIKQGAITEGEVDGTEEKWQIDWNMVGYRATGSVSQNGAGESIAPASSIAPTVSSAPTTNGGAVFLDADRAIRLREENVNDREAVRNVIAFEEPASLTIEGLIALAEPLANWYNTRLAARLAGGMVGAAQAAGATVVSVAPADDFSIFEPHGADIPTEPEPQTIEDILGGPEVPLIRNRAALGKWTTAMGWSKAQIAAVLQNHGFDTSADYLKEDENTAQGLAELLLEEIEE